MLISGRHTSIDVKDLMRHTVYIGGFSSYSSVIKWFWKVVQKMNDEEHAKLLMFVTSCPRSPLLGFASMEPKFCISKMDSDNPNEKLPTASTCFNILRLPAYTTEKVLYDKLMYAISANAGFEMV